jgi:hypothetical protein
MSDYGDNGFAKAQASYESRTDEDMYRDPDEDDYEEETDSLEDIDRAERAYQAMRSIIPED